MALTDVQIDEDAVQSLATGHEVQADLRDRMDRVADLARQTAPVDTGEYRASIHVNPDHDPDGSVHVDTGVHYAIYIEYGTRQTDRTGRRIHPARHTLGHALDAAGGDH